MDAKKPYLPAKLNSWDETKMSEAIYRKIVLLTDDEVELCVNGLLKGLTIENRDYAILFQSPEKMKEVIAEAAAETGISVSDVKDIGPGQTPTAVRHILMELVDDENFGPKVEAWIDGQRPSLLEHVTSALVLAGIIMVLSTDIDMGYQNKDGKKDLWVKFKKKPASEGLLKKFLGFFK